MYLFSLVLSYVYMFCSSFAVPCAHSLPFATDRGQYRIVVSFNLNLFVFLMLVCGYFVPMYKLFGEKKNPKKVLFFVLLRIVEPTVVECFRPHTMKFLFSCETGAAQCWISFHIARGWALAAAARCAFSYRYTPSVVMVA